MKKIKYLLFSLSLFLLGVLSVKAASFSVQTSSKNVVVGNTFTISVKVNGASGWEYCVNYDKSLYTLVSAKSDTGNQCVKTGSTMIGYNNVQFTFKANKSGTGTFSLTGANAYGDDGAIVSSTKGSVSVTAKTQAEIIASYSTNADLKSLAVEGYNITPSFNKDTLEYNLEVENDIENVKITCSKADANATINGCEEKALVEGNNRFEIVVTAQKGNQKSYIININRKELNPVFVTINGSEKALVRKSANLPELTNYLATTVMINDTEIPALNSEITGYTLIGTKDDEGNVTLYIYDNDKYTLYYELRSSSVGIYPLEYQNYPSGFSKYQVMINDNLTDIYKLDKDSKIGLIYGINLDTGEKALYQYDGNSFSLYYDEYVDLLSHKTNLYLWIAIFGSLFFGVLFLIVFVILLIVVNKKGKHKKVLKEEEINLEEKPIENNPPKKKKSKKTEEKVTLE